jgi:hypothetical protein
MDREDIKEMKKILITLTIALLMVSCTIHEVPQDAVDSCIKEGGVPHYKSNFAVTEFTCSFLER